MVDIDENFLLLIHFEVNHNGLIEAKVIFIFSYSLWPSEKVYMRIIYCIHYKTEILKVHLF